jgi:hypothetical protein
MADVIKTGEKIDLVKNILRLFEESLVKREVRLKPEQKAPKECQHVMCSKAAMERFLKEGPKEVLHTFRNIEYRYCVANVLYGFKAWKLWLMRVD